MANSKIKDLTDKYVAVTAESDFFVQNIGANVVECVLSEAAPSEELDGFLLEYEDVYCSTIVSGIVYARAYRGYAAARLSVTE